MCLSRKIVLIAGVALGAVAAGLAVSHHGIAASSGQPTVQLAALSPADTIAERRKLMKGQGAAAKAINDFLESGTGTADDVAKAAASIKESSAKIPNLFPAGTSMDDNVAETHAKKEIWANFDDFKSHAAKLGELATALQTAAATGDKEKIAAAFGTMGKEGCGGCHTLYRQKTQ
jgi:cytochrome c556